MIKFGNIFVAAFGNLNIFQNLFGLIDDKVEADFYEYKIFDIDIFAAFWLKNIFWLFLQTVEETLEREEY